MIPIGAAQSMATMQAETSHLLRPTGRNAMPSPAVAASLQAASLPAHAVALSGLTKIYRGRGDARGPAKPALDKVDLTIPRGALYGLLGPNGAGKSTLINILAGLVLKTAGRAVIWGIDIDAQPRQARAAIGVVPQELNIDPFFTPRELLDLHAGLYGVPKSERKTAEILEAVGLADKADSYARTLSGGMRRRLLVAKALVHSPPVLVLDEPTAGVDVELRRQLWSHVRALNAAGTTILLTTHYLEEAEELCDHIAIIDKGRVVVAERTEDLLRRLDDKSLTITLAERLAELPETLKGFHIEIAAPNRLVFRYRPSRTRLADLLAAVQASGLTVVDLATEETDLQDIFLQLTGTQAAARATS
jgi:ABC-2 type transport system ATP-binding protein